MAAPTNNMGLIVWDLGQDPYDYHQLANNWLALDMHNHSTGQGRKIPSGGIEDGAIGTEKIAANAITPDKIPNGSLTQQEFANDSVGSPQIIDGAVGPDEIADEAVGFDKLDPSVVPIGQVIMWYRPDNSVPVPDGWEILDGRPWSTVPNAWGVNTGSMPDTQGRVPSGASLTSSGSGPNDAPSIGQIGGNNEADLTHSHLINQHTHSVPDHTHGTASGGDHTHSTGTASGVDDTLVVQWIGGSTEGGNFPLDPAKFTVNGMPDHGHTHFITTSGGHTHGDTTGHGGPLTTGNPSDRNTNNGLSNTSVRNKYVGFLFLIRVN